MTGLDGAAAVGPSQGTPTEPLMVTGARGNGVVRWRVAFASPPSRVAFIFQSGVGKVQTRMGTARGHGNALGDVKVVDAGTARCHALASGDGAETKLGPTDTVPPPDVVVK